MNFTHHIGKLMIFAGLFLIAVGLIFLLFSKIGLPGGWRLPGDIYIKKDNFVFYFPITTSIILSVILSIIFRLIRK